LHINYAFGRAELPHFRQAVNIFPGRSAFLRVRFALKQKLTRED